MAVGKNPFASIGCSLDPCHSRMCWKIHLGNTFFKVFYIVFLLNPSIINTAHALWNSQLLFCQLIYKDCEVTSTASERNTCCSSLTSSRSLPPGRYHQVSLCQKTGQEGILSWPRNEPAVSDIGLMLWSCFTTVFSSSWLWDNRAKNLTQRSIFSMQRSQIQSSRSSGRDEITPFLVYKSICDVLSLHRHVWSCVNRKM